MQSTCLHVKQHNFVLNGNLKSQISLNLLRIMAIRYAARGSTHLHTCIFSETSFVGKIFLLFLTHIGLQLDIIKPSGSSAWGEENNNAFFFFSCRVFTHSPKMTRTATVVTTEWHGY